MRRVDWRGLPSFNELTERQAIGTLYECCSSSIWALRVARARPFSDDEALLSYADLILAELTDATSTRPSPVIPASRPPGQRVLHP